MKIDLNQDEIEAAIVAYVTDQGINLAGKGTDVTMTAGRGERGFTATVELVGKARRTNVAAVVEAAGAAVEEPAADASLDDSSPADVPEAEDTEPLFG